MNINSELRDRELIVKEAIERFLDDNELDISGQNISRLCQHLLRLFVNESSISTSMIHNYLQETRDYNEFNENTITNILMAADKNTPFKRQAYKLRPFIIAVILIIAVVAVFSLLRTEAPYDHIKPSQELIPRFQNIR